MNFTPLLLGKDLRSIGRVNEILRLIGDQKSFDELFAFLLHHDRLLVMRAADAVEKITLSDNRWLAPHKEQLLALLHSALHKELKWHLALLIARVPLSKEELREVWDVLNYWALNPNESKIVRANALQGLFSLTSMAQERKQLFSHLMDLLEREDIPSLRARIRRLRKQIARTTRSQ